MIAQDWGLVGFAADIFGAENQPLDPAMRGEIIGLYRGDADLLNGRISAAIEAVKAMPEVDPDNIALFGYCFGGTVSAVEFSSFVHNGGRMVRYAGVVIGSVSH